MTEGVLIAIITSIITLIGSLVGTTMANSKMKAVIMYRLDALEKKQDRHNGLIERMVIVEQSTKSAHHRIDEMMHEPGHE